MDSNQLSTHSIEYCVQCTLHSAHAQRFLIHFLGCFSCSVRRMYGIRRKWALVWFPHQMGMSYGEQRTRILHRQRHSLFIIFMCVSPFPRLISMHIRAFSKFTSTAVGIHTLTYIGSLTDGKYGIHAHDTIMARRRTYSSTFRVKKSQDNDTFGADGGDYYLTSKGVFRLSLCRQQRNESLHPFALAAALAVEISFVWETGSTARNGFPSIHIQFRFGVHI